jgi:hypothetical protein
MLFDLFDCECGRHIVPNKCVNYLDANLKLKWSNYEVKFGLVNGNVDVREGLSRILTKIFKGK